MDSRNYMENSLFLVCPADNLENVILARRKGGTRFYSALGGYLHYDQQTEHGLWKLVSDNNIKQICLISSVENVIFHQAVADKACKNTLRGLEDTLAGIRESLTKGGFTDEVQITNINLLAARYAIHQRNRLLLTKFLGRRIAYDNITVKVYVYLPQENEFVSPGEMERRGYFINNLSCN